MKNLSIKHEIWITIQRQSSNIQLILSHIYIIKFIFSRKQNMNFAKTWLLTFSSFLYYIIEKKLCIFLSFFTYLLFCLESFRFRNRIKLDESRFQSCCSFSLEELIWFEFKEFWLKTLERSKSAWDCYNTWRKHKIFSPKTQSCICIFGISR